MPPTLEVIEEKVGRIETVMIGLAEDLRGLVQIQTEQIASQRVTDEKFTRIYERIEDQAKKSEMHDEAIIALSTDAAVKSSHWRIVAAVVMAVGGGMGSMMLFLAGEMSKQSSGVIGALNAFTAAVLKVNGG